jgi:hypothetical protein
MCFLYATNGQVLIFSPTCHLIRELRPLTFNVNIEISSIPVIYRFGLSTVSHRSCIVYLYFLSIFSLSLSKWSTSYILFSILDTLFFTCFILLVRIFFQLRFYLGCWDFHFQGFNFFKVLYLYWILLNILNWLIILFSCLFEFFFSSFIYLFVSSLNSFRCLYMYSFILLLILSLFFRVHWKFICFTIVQVLYCEIVDFWRRHVALFFRLLVFHIRIYASADNLLAGSFNHL